MCPSIDEWINEIQYPYNEMLFDHKIILIQDNPTRIVLVHSG